MAQAFLYIDSYHFVQGNGAAWWFRSLPLCRHCALAPSGSFTRTFGAAPSLEDWPESSRGGGFQPFIPGRAMGVSRWPSST
jgi:hypothetical protein